MSVLFFILGGIVLVYWLFCMLQDFAERPEIIRRHSVAVFFVGLALVVLGFIL